MKTHHIHTQGADGAQALASAAAAAVARALAEREGAAQISAAQADLVSGGLAQLNLPFDRLPEPKVPPIWRGIVIYPPNQPVLWTF